jgi:hypothetical protein
LGAPVWDAEPKNQKFGRTCHRPQNGLAGHNFGGAGGDARNCTKLPNNLFEGETNIIQAVIISLHRTSIGLQTKKTSKSTSSSSRYPIHSVLLSRNGSNTPTDYIAISLHIVALHMITAINELEAHFDKFSHCQQSQL